MYKDNIYTTCAMTKSLVLLSFLMISGCGAPIQPSIPVNSELVLIKPLAGSNTYPVDAVFYNHSEKTTMEPEIRVIFFDQ